MSLVRRNRAGEIVWQHVDVRLAEGRWACRACGIPSAPPFFFYCSAACKKAFAAKIPPHWGDLAYRVMVRDEKRCVLCLRAPVAGDLSRRLEVDHIKPVALYPELEFDESNLRTLCHDCHVLHGARPGSRRGRAIHHPHQRRLEVAMLAVAVPVAQLTETSPRARNPQVAPRRGGG